MTLIFLLKQRNTKTVDLRIQQIVELYHKEEKALKHLFKQGYQNGKKT